MAKILPDKEIKKLMGSILIGAEESQLNPNGVELRLGTRVKFHSTGEQKTINSGKFLKVAPGESVTITSLEEIDFSRTQVQEVFPGQALMGLITPTTTMMREGITMAATKIDSGFKGTLNWGLRNSSTKDLVLKSNEPIFKLTIFRLDQDETPETEYGERINDAYQDSDGIVVSKRNLPVDIPKNMLVGSSIEKMDPKVRLQEAGYPFDHIGTELTILHGRFELVSSDMAAMQEEFSKSTEQLADKVDSRTATLSKKIDEMYNNVLDKMEALFQKKLLGVLFAFVTLLLWLMGGYTFLISSNVEDNMIVLGFLILGAISLFPAVIYLAVRK